MKQIKVGVLGIGHGMELKFLQASKSRHKQCSASANIPYIAVRNQHFLYSVIFPYFLNGKLFVDYTLEKVSAIEVLACKQKLFRKLMRAFEESHPALTNLYTPGSQSQPKLSPFIAFLHELISPRIILTCVKNFFVSDSTSSKVFIGRFQNQTGKLRRKSSHPATTTTFFY